MKKKSMDWYKQQQRFSVRKYHFGAASVLLGTALVFGGAQVSADEVTAPATPSTESTTATSAETTTASEEAPAVLTASEATPASLTASEASSSTEATSLDKGALQLALSQAKALDLSNKTSETVAILLAQIEHAQTVLNTATSQEELNQAVTDLQAAQVQLADKPAQPVAVSPASVATTPAPATSTTSSTPEATTPASPATVETSSSSPVVETPTRSRRTRRAVPTGSAPIEAVDATAQAAEKKDLEDKNAKLKSDYDAAVAHYNSETARINADNAAKKTAYDTAVTKYKADKKDYEDHLAANIAAAEATKNQDGHLSETHVQHLVFTSEPNAHVTVNGGQPMTGIPVLTTEAGRVVAGVGDRITVTYDGLEKAAYDGRRITKIIAEHTPISTNSPSGKIQLIPMRDIASNLWVAPVAPGYAQNSEVRSVYRFYYGDGSQVVFDPAKPAIVQLTELNNFVGNGHTEYAKDFNGDIVYISGSSIKKHADGYYSDTNNSNKAFGSRYEYTEYNTVGSPLEYYASIAGIAKGDNISVTWGEIGSGGTWYRFSGDVSTANLVLNNAVQPSMPTYETLPTAPVAPTYFTISNRLNYDPTGQDLTVKHNEVVNASDAISNKGTLPTGTTYTWKGVTPDTTTPGSKPVTVTVGYPDGTSEDVAITVTVTPVSDDYTPVGKDVPAKHGDTPSAASGIANKGDLPADATYTWKGTAPDTTTPGDKPATVVVTYDDGTVDEVPVTVKVQPQADDYDPQAQPVSVDHGATPNAEDGIANKGTLPPGTTYDWKTPIDTSTPGTKPGTVVVTYPDGTKDEVPVPVTVGEEAALYTPVGQDVPAKHGETPAASQGIANRGTLPAGTTYDWKTPVDTSTPGDKPATVVVTYPDGSKDEVPVTVKVKPQSDEFTPNGQDVPTKHGETPNAADGIANKGDLPADTKYDWKTPVDTSTPGDKPGTVVVTYPDGTKDEISVTVKVKPQSDEFTPQPKDVSTDHGKTPKAEDGIANKGDLPDGTKYDWKTPVDTTTPGDKPGTVVVTYPDGTKDEVPVTVHVGSQSDLYNPDGQNLNVKQGDQPEASKGIANRGNLPDGTTYDWKTPVDTSTVGDKPATVVVTYPDGSKDEVSVTVKVTEKLHVKTPADKVPVKDPSNLTPDDINKVVENIKKENPGLPDDAKITVNPNGGDTTIETKDGDKVTIPGSDLVRPETDADKNNVKVPADKVPVKDPSNLTDAEKDKVKDNIKNANPDLPNGTKIDVAKDGTATITFPDGSTKVIPGSDLVRPETDADRHTPKGQDVPVKQGETPKAEDGIANKGDLPNGTKIEWKETPDTSKVGDHNATIVITYPDGSKDEVTVTVKVSPNANNNGHNGNNGSQGNGNSGSHNNGTNGDQGQGDKDKKDQAGKDTNNGLDKLFSNSGNGSASGNQSGASRKQAPALPNTGDASNPAMALAFAALLGGTALVMKKRKKEEEE